jgi:two-component system response regulator PilR (NtrC family)
VPTLSAEVLQLLAEHPLHGNVRELENLLHRAVALSDGDMLHLDFVDSTLQPSELALREPAAPAYAAPPPAAATSAPPRGGAEVPNDLQGYLDQQEREILIRALQETGFNRTAAAARLGLSLRQIRYRIARLGIATPNGDDANAFGADE